MTPPLPPSRSTVASIHLSRSGVVLLALGLIVPWIALVIWLQQSSPPLSAPSVTPTVTRSAQPAPPANVSIGPWGELELTRIIIEPPDELITVDPTPVPNVTWYFPGYTIEKLSGLWADAELTSDAAELLTNKSRWTLTPDHIEVTVPKAILLGLSPTSRSKIYSALSPFNINEAQFAPFSYRTDTPDDWFADSGLSERTMSIVKPLIYRRAGSLLFSDLALIMSDISPMHERVTLVRTLARTSTQLGKIRIKPNTDIAKIADYWSFGARTREIEPLLKSLPHPAEGFTIDIIHLMPRFVRRLLYTFPRPLAPGEVAYRDCHWSALNFAKLEIDDRFADINEVTNEYRTQYYAVTDAPRFGDIYLLVRRDDVVLHACVHIAGDLVFTKNGTSVAAPWILMTLPDLLALYPSDEPLDVQHLRRRGGDS